MKKGMKLCLMMIMLAFLTVIGSANVKAGDVTLKNGKWAKGTLTSEQTEQWYKINIKKTGYIKIDYVRGNTKADYSTIYIYDKNKKLIDDTMWDGNKIAAYVAVKKGTYYIKIWDYAYDDWEEYNSEPDDTITESYKIKYTFKKMSAGPKFKNTPSKYKKDGNYKIYNGFKKTPKSYTLKKGKEVSGLAFHTGKGGEVWYKLELSEKQKVKFSYEFMGTSDFIQDVFLQITDNKGRLLVFDKKGNIEKDDDSIIYWDGKGDDFVVLDKGTWYFCVRAHEGGTGYYKLKIK